MKTFEIYTFLLPEWALAPIFNGDNSALYDDEIQSLNDFLNENRMLFNMPKGESFFNWHNDIDEFGGLVYEIEGVLYNENLNGVEKCTL